MNKRSAQAVIRRLLSYLESDDVQEEDVSVLLRYLVRNCERDLYLEHRLMEISSRVDTILERSEQVLGSANSALQFLIPKGPPVQTVNYMQQCWGTAKTLTICDPYLLKQFPADTRTPAQYAQDFETLLPPGLTSVEIFINKRNGPIASELDALCRTKGISVSRYHTQEIHDRVWIADGSRGYVVGTSFNSLGNKFAFVLDLSHQDLADFLKELDRIRSSANCHHAF